MVMNGKPICVYVSYADEDKAELLKLQGLMGPAAKEAGFELKGRDSVPPGGETEKLIRGMIQEADLIVCLLTVDYFNNPRTKGWEKKAIEARGREADESRRAIVVPVLVKPFAALDLVWPWVGQREMLPAKGKAVTLQKQQEAVWDSIANRLFEVIGGLTSGGGEKPASEGGDEAPAKAPGDGGQEAVKSPAKAPAQGQVAAGAQDPPAAVPTGPRKIEPEGAAKGKRTGAWPLEGASSEPDQPAVAVEPISGQVSGERHKQLSDALLDAFMDYADLEIMLEQGLGAKLARIASERRLDVVVLDILKWANKQHRIPDLVVAARKANPWNPRLVAFTQGYGAGPQLDIGAGRVRQAAPSYTILEKITRGKNGFLHPDTFIRELARREGQVCLIEYPEGDAVGTGFLVGADRVLTNAHVIREFQNERDATSEVVLRFDHRVLKDGRTVQDGTAHKLSPERWLLAFSPEDKLDYALLELASSPGEDELGSGKDVESRGFIKPSSKKLPAGTPIFILQHPGGQPLRLAFDTEGVIGFSEDGSLIWYGTSTEAGSSGSPCFDPEFKLVALHHGGVAGSPSNEGISIVKIVADLKAKGITL